MVIGKLLKGTASERSIAAIIEESMFYMDRSDFDRIHRDYTWSGLITDIEEAVNNEPDRNSFEFNYKEAVKMFLYEFTM